MEQDMKNVFITLAIAVSLMGCGDPKIDGTDKQSFEKSVRKIAESLPQEKRGQFMSDLGVANLLAMEGLSTGQSTAEINAQVLKKTRREISRRYPTDSKCGAHKETGCT